MTMHTYASTNDQ